jgi:hypothetical protein
MTWVIQENALGQYLCPVSDSAVCTSKLQNAAQFPTKEIAQAHCYSDESVVEYDIRNFWHV